MEHYHYNTCSTPEIRGGIHADVVELFPQHLVMIGLSTREQATKASKELIHVLKNTGPQTPFTTREIQLHATDKLAKIFNTMQPEKT